MNATVSIIIAVCMLAANFIVLLQIFPRRFNLHVTVNLFVLAATCHLLVVLSLDEVNFNYGGARGLLYFPLFIYMLKAPLFQKLFAFSLELVLTASITFLIDEIAQYFFGTESLIYNIFLLVLLLPVYIIYVILVTKNRSIVYQKLFAYGSRKEWGLYSFVGMISFGMMALTRIFVTDEVISIAIMFFILLSFAVLCFAIINTHEKTKKRIEAEFARGIVSSGQSLYKKINEIEGKLRVLRHDYKYHLSAVRQMLNSGNTKEAEKYLNSIEEQLSQLELDTYCGNIVINALVADYAERCVGLNIEFTVNIVIPESLGVSNYDMCIILGNLLENAVEACMKLEHNRFIELETHSKSTQLLIMIKNSFDGIIHDENGLPISAKTNGGFGLKSIREVISRHNGDLLMEWDEATFTVYAAVMV